MRELVELKEVEHSKKQGGPIYQVLSMLKPYTIYKQGFNG